MLKLVISGGQSGSDQAALRAARAAGIPTGGWAPKGWLTEDGPAPWLADYGLVECPEPGYPARTRANVRDSDGTLWFGEIDTIGGRLTLMECRSKTTLRPILTVRRIVTNPSEIIVWIEEHRIQTLNVAGNRESKAPGIGERTEAFLARVFAMIMEKAE